MKYGVKIQCNNFALIKYIYMYIVYSKNKKEIKGIFVEIIVDKTKRFP